MSSRYSGGVVRKNQLVPTTSSASGIWNLGEATQATKADIWPYANIAMPIQNSLRFRASASAYLNRTLGTPTNNKIFTWSAWVKRGNLAADNTILGATDDNQASGNFFVWRFTSSSLQITSYSSGYDYLLTTTQVFRDPSAWYHIVIAFDTTQATASNRAKIYVNGVQVTAFNSATYPSLNSNPYVNMSGQVIYTGAYNNVSSGIMSPYDGYMADVNFIDGQALTPSSFGQTSAITGVWEPKQYSGTYGTNGYHLEFKDATVGQDTSGNSNDWTPNNISTTLGTTYDLMKDVPTQFSPRGVTDVGGVVRGNYCTLNPIARGTVTNGTITGGNLNLSTTASDTRTYGTFGFPSSGKYYYELTNNNSGDKGQGIASVDSNGDTYQVLYFNTGDKRVDGTTSAYGASYTSGDVIGVAIDVDNNQITFYKNNTSQGAISYTFSSKPTLFPYVRREASTDASYSFNFGQRPFAYTPPSGFKSLCTTNLPTPTIGATTATAANKFFDATLYTGTGASQSIINSGQFQPDFVWAKSRSNTNSHNLMDSVRGTNKVLYSNLTSAEETNAQIFTALNSNGFSVGTDNSGNQNGQTFVGWQWKAGGAAVTNTAGTISSQVSTNTTSGFSVVTWTSPASGTATVGHGLGVAPSMIITKSRSSTGGWPVYHISIGNTNYLDLQLTGASTSTTFWNNTSPTSTVFTTGSPFAGSLNLVAYCFAPIAGYSAFGSYTGNGSTDGPFVYTGFRPRFVLWKNASAVHAWYIYDTERQTYNTMVTYLSPTVNSAEASPGGAMDILSNGFKVRNTGADMNFSGSTIIYMAFAENPFKNSLAR